MAHQSESPLDGFTPGQSVIITKGVFYGMIGNFVRYGDSLKKTSVVDLPTGQKYVYTYQVQRRIARGEYVMSVEIPNNRDDSPGFEGEMEEYLGQIGRVTANTYSHYLVVRWGDGETWSYREEWLTPVNLLWMNMPVYKGRR